MTKEDKIYKMLNDSKIDLTEYEETDLSTQEKNQLFQNIQPQIKPPVKQRRNQKWLVIAAAGLLLIAGSQTAIGQQVQATAVSIIENIRYSLSNALGNEDTETPGALTFNQTAQIGSAEVSIKDLIAFDHRIVFNVLVDMDGDIQDEHFFGFDEMTIQVNNQTLNTDFWVAMGTVYDEKENIHSNIYSIQLEEPIAEDELINVQIHFDGIEYYLPEKTSDEQLLIDGEATFSAETTRDELNRYTEVYDIQKNVTQNDFEFDIEKIYINPVLNFIEVSTDDKDVLDVDFQLMEFRGKDENGREVLFTQTNMFVSDDFRKYSFTLNEEASEITSEELADVDALELQFYVRDWPEGAETTIEFDPAGDPFTVDLTK